MTIQADIQDIAHSPEVYLYELTNFNPNTPADVFRFCSLHTVQFQGLTYTGIPCEGTGFGISSQGFPRPKLAIGNFEIPATGLLLSAVVEQFEDFIGATLIRRTTLEKYLDGQPTANPLEQFDPTYWKVEQKINDDDEFIQWELSFAGLEDMVIPRRSFFVNYCSWEYRGSRCGYTGAPVATILNQTTSDPALDRCAKNRQACKLRFGDGVLRFGGFPGGRFR
jgi:lambda family phage minor tail protein L